MLHLPTFRYERELAARGFRAVVGVDEAGSGALAGPVVAAAALFPPGTRLGAVRDSKLVGEAEREELYAAVTSRAAAWAVGVATAEEIARLGIRPANLLAMRRAVEGVETADFALVDAWTIPGLAIPQLGIVRGDRLAKSIAAASIVAKVARDRLMRELARHYPVYGFEIHKGYGTAAHREAIRVHGPCAEHRVGWGCFAGMTKGTEGTGGSRG